MVGKSVIENDTRIFIKDATLVMDYEKYYEPLKAVHSSDFNRCIYCGCEASCSDYVPPISFIHDWRYGNREADFISVPACTECGDLLKKQNVGSLEMRKDILKDVLADKYEKAIRVFNHWSEEEIKEMDTSFQRSLNGGLNLGKEAISRVRFAGFDYEVNGSITRVAKPEKRVFKVFEHEFDSFKEALECACEVYQIKKSRLSQLYFESGESFDKAIETFHHAVEEKKLENEIKIPCRDFAKKYKQNSDFVLRTVKKYMTEDEELDVNMALAKLLQKYH